MDTAGERLMTVEDVQEYLAVGRTTAYRLVASGEVETVRIGRAVRVRRSVVDDWVRRRTLPASSRA